ncbi:MAG: biotin--[acetyl-CoA-carboxylase] ligase [Desulfurococcaceae archaeon]
MAELVDNIPLKLELLRILANKSELSLMEIEREVGISMDEALAVIDEMKRNYMIRLEKSSVKWLDGDNPLKINPWGWNYVYRPFLGSTMKASKHLPTWSIVIAEYQSSGIGRHGKKWLSNLGGIWMTAKFNVSPSAAQLLPITVPTLLCRFLRERIKLNAQIKWPNDIILGDKKAAGFLIEGEYVGTRIIAYVGIGINVNNDPPLETAISIKDVIGQLIPRNRVISYIVSVMGRIEKYAENRESIKLEYLEYMSTLGRKVLALTRSGEIRGVARSISETGDLVIETETGSLKLSSNEILMLRHID